MHDRVIRCCICSYDLNSEYILDDVRFFSSSHRCGGAGAGAGAGRKMKQAAAGAVATKQDGYGYPATSSPAGYPAVPCCPHPPEGGRG
jgi:hypothetical protein